MTLTRRIILAFVELRGGALLRLAMFGVFAVALPIAIVIDLVRAALREQAMRDLVRDRAVTCPAGHTFIAWGSFTCPSCGFTYGNAHGFAPCRACGALADLQCACGRSVPHPFLAGAS